MKAGPETGSALVAVCALAALTVALGAGLVRLNMAGIDRARAQTAADAAALAAAAELAGGRTGPEARRTAEATAGANGARLEACDCRSGDDSVEVAVVMPRRPFLPREVRAAARAEVHPECPG